MELPINFILNQKTVEANLHPAATVLDYIRKHQHLTGTKEGCREGDCGACTILVGSLIEDGVQYKNVNSCLMPLGQAEHKHIVTIEGLNCSQLSPIQQAFVDEGGTQCGFCTPGFIVSLTSYLLANDNYNIDDAIDSIAGNVCRCTGHTTIKRAVKKIIDSIASKTELTGDKISSLISLEILPTYFAEIPTRLKTIRKAKPSQEYEQKSDFIVAGGTDLFVQKEDELRKSKIKFYFNDNSRDKVWIEGNQCFIDAKAAISDFGNSDVIQKYLPEIKKYIRLFGSLPIRNRATIGGNIINASPIGDMTCILLALNAALHLEKDKSTRQVQLKDFYKGYKSLDKSIDEILTKISFELPKQNTLFNFEKVSRRIHLDIASVNTAMQLKIDNGIITHVNISAGGVAPIPLYLTEMRKSLLGKKINSSTISEALQSALSEVNPITDVRGSADYKKLLLRQLLLAHFHKFSPQLIEEELTL
ncbi:MAG: FAD binding domain-containing protein [Ignavibacteriaceae bacterium]|nr:FAD binding domain-containing protein [Ignavibacteriaceae bacterium]